MYPENTKVIIVGWVFIFLICVGVVFFISTSLKNQAVAQQEQFTELTEPEKKHVREIIQDLLTNPTSWKETQVGIFGTKIFDKGQHSLLVNDAWACIKSPYTVDGIKSDSFAIAIQYADQRILTEEEKLLIEKETQRVSAESARNAYFNQPWSEKCEPPAEVLRALGKGESESHNLKFRTIVSPPNVLPEK